jgi:4-hydroxybenzoate polyprenyltransferase
MSQLAGQLETFARDIKLSHTVFAMPFALLAMFLAAGGWPHWGIILLILLCMVSARTLAMGTNRLLDAKLDAANPRTAGRAIPAGRLTTTFYAGMIALCAAVFIAATAGFWKFYANPWPLYLSVPVLAFLAGYPLMKRFTRLCHYYLGMALGLAPICAYVATKGAIALEPLLMAAAVVFWTGGFDVLYACQDYQTDVATRLFSVPAKIGIVKALWVARLSHVISWGLLVTLWFFAPQLHLFFAAGILAAGALLIYEHSLVKPNDLSKLNMAFFTLNGIISSMLGLCGIIDVLRS